MFLLEKGLLETLVRKTKEKKQTGCQKLMCWKWCHQKAKKRTSRTVKRLGLHTFTVAGEAQSARELRSRILLSTPPRHPPPRHRNKSEKTIHRMKRKYLNHVSEVIGIQSRQRESKIYRTKVCTQMFIATLLITTKKVEWSSDGWTNKLS